MWYKKKKENNVEKEADKEDGEDGDKKYSIFICCKERETDGNVHNIICVTAVYIHAVNYNIIIVIAVGVTVGILGLIVLGVVIVIIIIIVCNRQGEYT